MRHQQPQRVILVGADFAARIHAVIGERVGRQRPLAIKEAHVDGRVEDGGAREGIGTGRRRCGVASVDRVEEIANVDVDVCKGLL